MAKAKKKAPKKKRAVPKKVAKKKATSRSVKTKKATKKVAKKRTSRKKAATKKTAKKVARKKVTKRKNTKKLKVTTTDRNVSTKVHISDRSHSTDFSVKRRILEPSEIRLVRPISEPFLTNQHVLKRVASYTGVVAVVLGGILSIINMQSILDPLPVANHAQVANVTGGTGDVNPTETEPEPRITINSTGILSGIQVVAVTVPFAEEVVLLANSMSSNQLFTLGHADQLDDSTWKMEWDTRQFEDGEYRLKSAIVNRHGSYDYSDYREYVLENIEEIPEEEEVEEDIDTEEENTESNETETEAEDTAVGVRLAVESGSTLSEYSQLDVFVNNSTKVKLYAKNTGTLNTHFIGRADDVSENQWKLKWDTRNVVDGLYKIHAIANVGDTELESDYVEVYVENNYEENPESSTTTESTLEEQEDSEVRSLYPEIELSLPEDGPLSNFVIVNTKTPQAKWVEIYAVSKNSLVMKFLGLSKKDSDGYWKYIWDTRHSPNGEYLVHARVKTEFGFVEGDKVSVVVKNDIPVKYSLKEEENIESLTMPEGELFTVKDPSEYSDNEEGDTDFDSKNTIYIDSVDSFMENYDLAEGYDDVSNELKLYREELNDFLNNLARATRSDDDEKVEAAKGKIVDLERKTLSGIDSYVDQEGVKDEIERYISQTTSELERVTLRNESLLKDRVGELLEKDSDKDSISDYDEINLYKTNPYVADSDGDGFIDSAEIENGYNPNDSRSEALIVYESPKESGIVREDLFVVENITNVEPVDDTQGNTALITGKGLPNSFVTIYIFSTPVIVTVRTDQDGSWEYIFDKELEDGEHEVYVGVTDNTGKIVGKSEPLTFVKTAEAYTVPDNEPLQLTPDVSGESLLESRILLLVGSLAVVSLGLVLILIGLHVTDRRKEEALIVKV